DRRLRGSHHRLSRRAHRERRAGGSRIETQRRTSSCPEHYHGVDAMKRLLSSIRIAFRALAMNKLRSALTMLGIVIGVASVIATVAVGSGATQRIQEQIASIGSNIIIITPGSTSTSGVRLGTGGAVTLSEADARDI